MASLYRSLEIEEFVLTSFWYKNKLFMLFFDYAGTKDHL